MRDRQALAALWTGLGCWVLLLLLLLVAIPAPLQTRITLLMPLVLAPRLLALLPARAAAAGFTSRDAAGWPASPRSASPAR